MNNHIRKTTIEVRQLSAAGAEVWLTAELDRVTSATELRGALTGPRCPGVTTVEVAYPLRPLPRTGTEPANTLTMRAVIPEPNLWTPATPFVYEGRIELWQDDNRADVAPLAVGLRLADSPPRRTATT
jgi:Glycosyl hydrolases family 2